MENLHYNSVPLTPLRVCMCVCVSIGGWGGQPRIESERKARKKKSDKGEERNVEVQKPSRSFISAWLQGPDCEGSVTCEEAGRCSESLAGTVHCLLT